MKFVITGASGFLGRYLAMYLGGQGHTVIGLTRNPVRAKKLPLPNTTWVAWDGQTSTGWSQHLNGDTVVINLAGENIGGGLWTEARKQRILSSRVNAGKAVLSAVQEVKEKPRVLIQASATGFYGSRGGEILLEDSPPGRGFLAEVVQQWEKSTEAVEAVGVLRYVIRMGIVIGAGGGLVARMKWPFLFCLGAYPAVRDAWASWIHIRDVAGAVEFLLSHQLEGGVYNLTAPEPAPVKEFYKTFGRILKRPVWLALPPTIIESVLGEMGREMILAGQRVLPRRLVTHGYTFKFPTLVVALSEALGRRQFPPGYSEEKSLD